MPEALVLLFLCSVFSDLCIYQSDHCSFCPKFSIDTMDKFIFVYQMYLLFFYLHIVLLSTQLLYNFDLEEFCYSSSGKNKLKIIDRHVNTYGLEVCSFESPLIIQFYLLFLIRFDGEKTWQVQLFIFYFFYLFFIFYFLFFFYLLFDTEDTLTILSGQFPKFFFLCAIFFLFLSLKCFFHFTKTQN